MSGFPTDISENGHLLDELFYYTVFLTGGTFLVVVGILLYFLIRYRRRPGVAALYSHGDSRGALTLTLGFSLAVFVLIDLNLAWRDHHVFMKLFGAPPKADEAMVVDVVAEVFQWNFRWAGPDGRFGGIDLKQADATDPFGLRAVGDDAGLDDIVSVGVLRVPVGREIVLKMKSRDVIHSLFLPNLRIKQDVVPGLETSLYFKAVKPGEYEIACAELCGLGHYRMRGLLLVLPQEEYDGWIKAETEKAEAPASEDSFEN